MSVFTRRGRRSVVLLAALAVTAALLAPGPAQAKSKRELTVMTQNLYLGADLDPAIAAATPEEFFEALGGILAEFQATDYEARSAALANEILATQPDLIGLQEVAIWTLYAVDKDDNVLGVALEVDFLDILQQQLAGRGLSYTEVAVSDNADIGNPDVGVISLGNGTAIRFRDRDVILENNDTEGLEITGEASDNYEAQVLIPTPIEELPFVSFNRGWAYVDGRFQDRSFRFINTHLEVELFGLALGAFGQVQELQAAEFLAGPANVEGPVIAVGDFNSAADGSTTASYGLLTESFSDTWGANRQAPGFTCCQESDLANKKTELNSRIDLILTRGVAKTWPAHVVANKRFQKKSPPFWASDHAGVVAVIQLG